MAKKYNELRAAGERLEIVFISSDRDEASFNEYHSEMPWAALPYANRSAKTTLSERYKVAGIPSLILLDPALNVVHPNARSAVTSGQPFPWTPKLVTDIDDDAEGINDTPSIIALLQAVPDAARSAAVAVLEAAAAADKQLVGRGGTVCGIDGVCLPAADPVLFFTATDPSPESLASRVRNLFGCGEPSAEPTMVLADLASGGKFHRHTGPVTEETIRKLLADFRSGSLNEMETLGDADEGGDDD